MGAAFDSLHAAAGTDRGTCAQGAADSDAVAGSKSAPACEAAACFEVAVDRGAASDRAASAVGAERHMRTLEEVGLGVDIVEIDRMRAVLSRTPHFKTKVFSEGERAYCEGKGVPEIHYATRFAAKEAVLKALGTGFSEGVGVRDIEVVRSAKGKPTVALYGRAKEIAAELGVVEIPLSLSYTHTEAVACAMAITAESVRAAEKRVDPMEELARQFKEARALLDEMDAKPSGALGIGGTADPAETGAAAGHSVGPGGEAYDLRF